MRRNILSRDTPRTIELSLPYDLLEMCTQPPQRLGQSTASRLAAGRPSINHLILIRVPRYTLPTPPMILDRHFGKKLKSLHSPTYNQEIDDELET
ncbi:hypothetical protein WAI453_007969 [Rhynchosporium graminicola]